MAASSRRFLLCFTSLLLFAQWSLAKTVTYDFNVTWVTANPDGQHPRKVVGINGQWPLPVIEVDKGDRIIANVYNGLGDRDTSIHWHGMFQNTTNYMDGAQMATQCPIPPGSSFTYNFTVTQNGTYWYHCHTDGCYPDGYRQALVVHDKDAYFDSLYEEEFTLTMSDWYHDLVEDIKFIDVTNPTGAEPVPDSFLVNDTQGSSLAVEPGKTYLLRLLNMGAFVGMYFYIEDHSFTIVEIDGVYTEPTEADLLYISVAQRYSILLTTKNSTTKNYPIVTIADSSLLDDIQPILQLNHTNWLEYNPTADHPQAIMPVDTSTDLLPFDDITLTPHDRTPLLSNPDLVIEVTALMDNLADGAGYSFFNNISYTRPKVPTLYTVLSSGDLATTPTVYGEYTHPFILSKNQVVELILNNGDTGAHPFHLHGHNFQLVSRYPSYAEGFFKYADSDDPVTYNPSNHSAFPQFPARRDTFVVPPQGYFVIRFRADNPGVWLFHCHIDWHMMQGLALSLIEAPLEIQNQATEIPDDHWAACAAANVPDKGNAAGNVEDLLDLTGQNKQLDWLPAGFTARGIVALVFSCVSAVLGLAVVSYYGMSGLPPAVQRQEDGNEDGDEDDERPVVDDDASDRRLVT
ncbi:Cupredoxin [Aspergillus karnatakaensis]|uniref:putative ferrooxidoreductase Fet3 n=1 Tax=Aspergillus karnatakaensis TaxID=1810916 RepID=UPI003CCDF322